MSVERCSLCMRLFRPDATQPSRYCSVFCSERAATPRHVTVTPLTSDLELFSLSSICKQLGPGMRSSKLREFLDAENLPYSHTGANRLAVTSDIKDIILRRFNADHQGSGN